MARGRLDAIFPVLPVFIIVLVVWTDRDGAGFADLGENFSDEPEEFAHGDTFCLSGMSDASKALDPIIQESRAFTRDLHQRDFC
jgi:hypothetical protein